jgi:hypothetical protein
MKSDRWKLNIICNNGMNIIRLHYYTISLTESIGSLHYKTDKRDMSITTKLRVFKKNYRFKGLKVGLKLTTI